MSDSMMTNNLVQTWVPVTDDSGRSRLEARWTTPAQNGAPRYATHNTPHAA